MRSVASSRRFGSVFSTLFLLLFSSQMLAEWEKVNVSTTASLRGLSVVGADVVWASGTGGTVIRTVDGGKHWSVVIVAGAEKLDFRGIHAFDANNALLMSSGPAEKGEARIYRTTDGGATWRQVFEEKRAGVFFDAIAFWDRQHGIVLSDPVEGKFVFFRTSDSGKSWKQIPTASLPDALPNEGAFAASNSCLTVNGAKNAWFATGGANIARVFRSHDRGKTWVVAETPLRPPNASSGIFSLAFEDWNFGVAVGGDYANPGGSGLPNLLITTNGGKTWQVGKPNNQAGFYISSVVIPPHPLNKRMRTVIAAGATGLYFASLNDDESWKRSSQENLNAVFDSTQGTWAVGANGTVLHLSTIIRIRDTF